MTQVQSNGPNVAMREPAQVPPGTSPELAAMLNRPVNVPVIDGAFSPDSLESYQRIARGYIVGDMVPAGLAGRSENETLARVTMCLEAGSGLGLSSSQAVQNIMVVRNRPALWGDAIPGLIRSSGLCVKIEETFEGSGETLTAVCSMVRIHTLPDGSFERETIIRRFGVANAKQAQLWGKQGPWTNYPQRMLQIRARTWAGRDGFADVLMGFGVVEELQDIPDGSEPSPELKQVRERVAALPVNPAPTPVQVAAPVLPPIKSAPAPEPSQEGGSNDYEGHEADGDNGGETYAGGVTEAEIDAAFGTPPKSKQGTLIPEGPTTVSRRSPRPK